jgi:hypothetical protein
VLVQAKPQGRCEGLRAESIRSIGLKRFERAMERLFERKEIHVAAHGPASRGSSYIARGAKER